MPFTRYTGKAIRKEDPIVALRLKGKIGFNRQAVRQHNLDKFGFAVLYYDKSTKAIGIEFTNDGKAIGAFRVCRPRNCRDIYISARSFCIHFKIPYGKTRRSILSKDLDTPNFYRFTLPRN